MNIMKIHVSYGPKWNYVLVRHYSKNKKKNTSKCFSFNSDNKKKKFSDALDFGVSVTEDMYLSTVHRDVMDFIHESKHPILDLKNTEFL